MAIKHYYLFFVFAILAFMHGTVVFAQQADMPGKQLAFERSKGNCLACHELDDGDMPGNIGPPLTQIAQRFKNKQQLRLQIWDATQFNPQTSMPPFGKNNILTEQEIDMIVDYLWTL